jgi:hypothetical protein
MLFGDQSGDAIVAIDGISGNDTGDRRARRQHLHGRSR